MKKLWMMISIMLILLTSCLGKDILEKSANQAGNSEEEDLPENYNAKLDGIWVLGGDDGTGVVARVDYYEAYNNTWHAGETLDIPVPVRNASCASYDNKIYVFGGINGSGTVLDTVQVYDVINNTWTTDDVMPAVREGHGAITADGNIYILGGSSTTVTNQGVQTIYRFRPYNSSGSRWSASLGNFVYTYTRMDFGYAYLDGQIIYGGGRYTNGARYTYISTFWPVSQGYQNSVGYLRQARSGVAGAAYSSNDKKYVFFSGGTTTNNVDQFPTSMTVSSRFDIYVPYSENGIRVVLSGPVMNYARAYAQAVVKGNYLYVLGGSASTASVLSVVERINATSPLTSSWVTRNSMPGARRGFCAVSLR